MIIVQTIPELRNLRSEMKATVGFVPTMGGIHEGHLGLVQEAKKDNETVLASVFLNPKQFTVAKDFQQYQRDISRDCHLLRDAGVDLAFVPETTEVYPENFQTYVEVEQLSTRWEGAARPGHFRAVATVVTILLNITQPNRAYFGQKDIQQVAVIRQMVRDLQIPTEIVVIPTVRAKDGLALSTRNNLLNSEERYHATYIYAAFSAVIAAYENGGRDVNDLRISLRKTLASGNFTHIDYAEIVDVQSLLPLQGILTEDDVAMLLVAVYLGETRLIDNCLIPAQKNNREVLCNLKGYKLR